MPKRGENIYKRKDNRWEGRYYTTQSDGSRKQCSVYARSYAAVREKLLICKEKERQNLAHLPECRLTVENLFRLWLTAKADSVKVSSYRHYENIINIHLLPELGKCLLNNLTVKKLSVFIKQKQKNLAAKTVADILAIIKAVIRMATVEYNLPQAAAILEIKPPVIKQKFIEPFTEPEIKTLSYNILSNPQPMNLSILLALNCGLRLGEVCALQWQDIDFAAQTLTVKRNVQRLTLNGSSQLIIQTPKSDCSRRTIPLTAEILSVLCKLCKSGAEFIFGGNKPLEPRTLQYHFVALLKSCDIKYRNFHTLRHTFASRYIEAGADVKSLSEILGHAGVNITMHLYVHPSMAQKRVNMERINFLQGLCA